MNTVTSLPTSATNITMTLTPPAARTGNRNVCHEITTLELPGPFVVLQGIPGDGMANTIDTMPILAEEDFHNTNLLNNNTTPSNSIPEDAAANLDMDLVLGRRGYCTNSHGAREQLSIGGSELSSNLHASSLSIPSDLHISHPLGLGSSVNTETPSRSLSVMTADLCLEEDGELVRVDSETSSLEVVQMPTNTTTTTNHSTALAPPAATTSTTSTAAGILEEASPSQEIVQEGHHAPTSITAVGVNHHRAILPIGPQIPVQNILPSEGGLHLPLPSSTVGVSTIGMGYSSILVPPHQPATQPSTNTAGARHISQRTVSQQHSSNQRQELDAFVLVSDSMQLPPTPTHSNTVVHDPHPQSSGSTSSSLSNSTSQSRIDILPSQNSAYMNLNLAERSAIFHWNRSCRSSERRDWKDSGHFPSPLGPSSQNNNGASSNSRKSSPQQTWWKSRRSGCLLVFESIPSFADHGEVGERSSVSIDSISSHGVQTGPIIGELPPGSTVLASAMHTIPKTWPTIYVLEIESPYKGFVLYSHGSGGYSYLAPGLPSQYVTPEIWSWRVCCPDGAFVRNGLELTSTHVDTIPYGSFVRVVRKTINGMGLSRLKIEAVLGIEQPFNQIPSEVGDRDDSSSVGTIGPSTCNGEDIGSDEEERQQQTRVISGWISEALNPLSGQSGFVVQPSPFPVPALYKVTLSGGAVIRDQIELSSAQIGHAPQGTLLTIVGRAYSQHPMDQCIERLRLAGGGGWVSVRLNRPPPRDELVLELVGIDGTFDPREPGLYHLKKQKEVWEEYQNVAGSTAEREEMERNERMLDVIRSMRRQNTGGDISSINDDEEGDAVADLENSGELSNTCSSITAATASVVPTLYRSGVAAGGSIGSGRKLCGSKALADERCLICLTESRSATIVHGETGHIACCLTCARILKARGDKVRLF